jgi:hypothetical protein
MLRIRHPPTYPSERRYIYDVLLRDFLGLEYRAEVEDRRDVRITVDGSSPVRELILIDVLFQTPTGKWLKPTSLPRRPLDRWEIQKDRVDANRVSQGLPVVYGTSLSDGSFCRVSGPTVTLGLDVFGSAFFTLTRYEEVVKPDRDDKERFPAGSSLAYQEGFLDRPIVNEYLEVLRWALERLWPGLRTRRRMFRTCLSHDVDRPFCTKSVSLTLRGVAGDIVKRKNLPMVERRIQSFVKVRRNLDADLCNTFDFIMSLSEEHGLKSSFNFITGRSARRIDGDYSMDHPWIRKLLRQIHERGHEVGFHPSYNTFDNSARLRNEFALLLRTAKSEGIVQREWGGRQHYLRWNAPITWQAWENAGIDYDSTLTFADRIGFRCGTCYEYQVFNLQTRTALELRERPLIAMETSALSKNYMSLSFEQAKEEIGKLKQRCRSFDGDFTLLWHNNLLVQRREQELYRDIVEL